MALPIAEAARSGLPLLDTSDICTRGGRARRRYFVLDAGGVCWYEDEAAAIGSKPRGRIRIGWIRSASPASGKGPGRFVLVCHVDGREHSYDLEARPPCLYRSDVASLPCL